jgi:2-phospho-L-lactate guanylyltransferase
LLKGQIEPVRVIVPLKVIKRSKTRLSGLRSEDRAKLTRAMLRNVLVALGKARGISEVTVVSGDRTVSRMAHRFGAKFLWEGKRPGLNEAVKLAIAKLDRRETGAAMIIHADLPLLTSQDIDSFVARSKDCQIAIVPCKNGTGTNALLLRPPNAIPPVFGKGSYKMHLSLAKRTGFQWKVLRIRGIQFDVDDLRDVRVLMRNNGHNRDFRFLMKTTGNN